MGKIGDWLKSSYATHGDSTSGKSGGNRRNTDDTPTAKVTKAAKQTTTDTKVVGPKSGGGSSSISNGSAPKDGKTKYTKGLMQRGK